MTMDKWNQSVGKARAWWLPHLADRWTPSRFLVAKPLEAHAGKRVPAASGLPWLDAPLLQRVTLPDPQVGERLPGAPGGLFPGTPKHACHHEPGGGSDVPRILGSGDWDGLSDEGLVALQPEALTPQAPSGSWSSSWP